MNKTALAITIWIIVAMLGGVLTVQLISSRSIKAPIQTKIAKIDYSKPKQTIVTYTQNPRTGTITPQYSYVY